MEEGDLKEHSGFWSEHSEFEMPADCAGEISTWKLRGETFIYLFIYLVKKA